MDDFERDLQRQWQQWSKEQGDAEFAERRDKEAREGTGGDGLIGGLVALLLVPYVLVWAVNTFLPFWLRCIFALVAGPLTVKYLNRKWPLAPVARILIGIAVSGLLFGIFRDGDGFGMAVFNLYAKILVGGLCLLIVGGLFMVVRDRFRVGFALFGKHPLQIGCIGLVALWAVWTLFMAAAHPAPLTSHTGLTAGDSTSGGHQ